MDIIDVKSPLEQQIQDQKSKDNGRIFAKFNSMTISFHKIFELN